jgi:hypothetical protein
MIDYRERRGMEGSKAGATMTNKANFEGAERAKQSQFGSG